MRYKKALLSTQINLTEDDKDSLRIAIISELDAINLYEKLASISKSETVKKVLFDIAGE